ncbi:uncharacterized protein Dwil_GK17940 [Drosophila willistoni]|uniref:Uncharacterized protein n=1 Tax=Drosophila willistoni TaxID=7260 RepID=B4N5U5_DROWI|nr:zingipain-1 [Drosophila willistoni]EDW79734.1 uncharacterized protein Dwil_GK17940 [Drosophila willistoni]
MLKLVFSILVGFVIGGYGFNHGADLTAFEAYVKAFNKTYATTSAGTFANYYYIYNRNQVNQHNAQQDRNRTTYREAVNQFSDIRLIQFAALLPKAVYPTVSHASTAIDTTDPVSEIDIISDLGMNVTVANQGTNCSSSWAYAAAKSIEIMNAIQTGNLNPLTLSAQELLDCAGMGTACTTQVPQIAFDYLTQYSNLLTDVEEYPNNNTLKTQGMCLPDQISTGVQLATYATIAEGDDVSLQRFVSNNIPVIVEYNPATFGFMQYSSGVYVPPTRIRTTSSQFLVVVGYGHDTDTGLDYWNCLNSFGTTWGENGYIRIIRSDKYPLAKNAIFPNTF